MTESFMGKQRRERISLAREWDKRIITITSGQALSEAVDVRMAAGLAVSVDDNMTATYLAVYTSDALNGAYRPARDKDGTLLTVPRTAGSVMVLPAEVFPLGYICIASCSNATGTLLPVTANRVLVLYMKP